MKETREVKKIRIAALCFIGTVFLSIHAEAGPGPLFVENAFAVGVGALALAFLCFVFGEFGKK